MTREKPRATVGRHATNLIELETIGFTVSRTVCDSVSVLVPEDAILVSWSGSVSQDMLAGELIQRCV